jgi:hypothetical protein
VLPWSATAQLIDGSGRYWVKVADPSKTTTESRILCTARSLQLTTVPSLLAVNIELGALVLAHVVADGHDQGPGRVLETLRETSRVLSGRRHELRLESLTAAGCAARISALCDPGGSGQHWLGQNGADQLRAVLRDAADALCGLDQRLADDHQVLHGDCHAGNVLWRRSGPLLVDWADAAFGSPQWDRAMVFAGATHRVLGDLKGVSDLLSTPPYPHPQALSVPLNRVRTWMVDAAASLTASVSELREDPGGTV